MSKPKPLPIIEPKLKPKPLPFQKPPHRKPDYSSISHKPGAGLFYGGVVPGLKPHHPVVVAPPLID